MVLDDLDALDELGAPLRDAYANAWERIVAEQKALAEDPLRLARQRRLAEMRARVEEQLDDLEKVSNDWIANQFPRAYMLGGQAAVTSEGGGVGQFVWSQINEEAVQRLAGGLHNDLLKATDGVKESTRQLIRAVSRDESLQALIEGRTAKQAGISMQRILETKGISAVTYADKSRHGLKEYSSMVQRTQTAIAYNEGAINQYAQSGTKYVEVFDGPSCGWTFHNDTTLANGLVVTLEEARAWPISHPNCRRGFGGRPDVRTSEDARQAQGGQVTDSQMESQRLADRSQPGEVGRRYTQDQIDRGQFDVAPHPRARVAGDVLVKRDAKLAQRTMPGAGESPPVQGVKGKAQLRREAEYARQATERERLGTQYNAQKESRATVPKSRKPKAGPNLKDSGQSVDPLRGITLQETDGNFAWKLDRQINRWTVTGPDVPPGSVINVVSADGLVSQQVVIGVGSTRGKVAQLFTRPVTADDVAAMKRL